MKTVFIILFYAGLALICTSCAKEYSFEGSPPLPVDTINNNPVLGNRCRIEKIVSFLSNSSNSRSAITAYFNSLHEVQQVLVYDSLRNQAGINVQMIYKGDTVSIVAGGSSGQYFLLDAGGRAGAYYFNGLIYRYLYNTAGFMEKQEIYVDGNPPVQLSEVNYQYTNNNLTRVSVIALPNIRVKEAELEYYVNKPVSQFLYFFPGSPELSAYQLGLNLGRRSEQAIKKMVIRDYNVSTGQLIKTSTTNFLNYQLSRENYVMGFNLSGDELLEIGFLSGRNRVEYHCW